MRTWILAVAIATAAAAAPARAGDPRWPDHATREAAVGCWDVGRGATLTLTRYGKHSLWATTRFAERPRGGPETFSEMAIWLPARRAFEVPCRPMSIHGSFCQVRPEAGRLRVHVYAKKHGSGATGYLAEDLLADRCPR